MQCGGVPGRGSGQGVTPPRSHSGLRCRLKSWLDSALPYSWPPVCVHAHVCVCACICVCVCVLQLCVAFPSFKDFASLQVTPSPQLPSAQRSPSHGLIGHSIWGSGPHPGERGLQQTSESLGLPWWLRRLSVGLQCGRPGFKP